MSTYFDVYPALNDKVSSHSLLLSVALKRQIVQYSSLLLLKAGVYTSQLRIEQGTASFIPGLRKGKDLRFEDWNWNWTLAVYNLSCENHMSLTRLIDTLNFFF